jgi:hypothetical protein
MNAPIETRERPILMSRPMVRATLRPVDPKTQTRRVCKNPITPNGYRFDRETGEIACHNDYLPPDATLMHCRRDGVRYVTSNYEGWESECPYGLVGHTLWIRETWMPDPGQEGGYLYRADLSDEDCAEEEAVRRIARKARSTQIAPWRPGIHMPRSASRITLEITEVRVQRLQDISTADIWAEGVTIPTNDDGKPLLRLTGGHEPHLYSSKRVSDWTEDDWARTHWAALWQQINAKRPGCSWTDNPFLWAISFKRIEAGT